MTANFIAQVVENYYNKLDLEKMAEPLKGIKKYNSYGGVSDEWANTRIEDPTYIRWCQAVGILRTYLRQNFETFRETELVYKWAKDICDDRNHMICEWRVHGGYRSFSDFLKRKNDY